ncbi:DUF6792 domain-containing protein [Leifsonia sp. WHRI 6310E]|uniref:DUF6792 domain-containing protein n=1 Tax=Leifsonia sp. WHRI 6310E TaxID=3162562 RepID=UPI0032EAFCF0
MTTAQDYKSIADESYRADPLEFDPPLKVGDPFNSTGPGSQEFRVIEAKTDPVTGFQGIAVVPVVDGEPDFSTVYISFAGTNPNDRGDILADAQSVVGGKVGPGTQADQALEFAAQVQWETRKKHPDASFETVGHSLGGFLAMLVAAEMRWRSTSFNGPDPWDSLSPEAKKWLREQIAAGKNPFTNFVNQLDVIGNLFGNGTGAGLFVKDEPGRGIIDYHDLSTGFEFNSDGSIKNTGGAHLALNVSAIIKAMALVDGADPRILAALEAKLAEFGRSFYRGAGRVVSRLIVAVDTVGAAGLAASVGETAIQLAEIKRVNGGLVPAMTDALTGSKNAASLLPTITELDIENCVAMFGLGVRENIDLDAVDHVDRLVDDHLETVGKISDGVMRTVQNAAAQDAQWAQLYSGR